MFQLTYKMDDTDQFLHQISQLGAHFVSKGPESETYYKSPHHQLRIEEGVNVELVLIKTEDKYQELIEIDVKSPAQITAMLEQALGEKIRLTKQVVRYYLKNVLLEIHRFEKLPQLLYIQAESLNTCRDMARQLGLIDSQLISRTPADLK